VYERVRETKRERERKRERDSVSSHNVRYSARHSAEEAKKPEIQRQHVAIWKQTNVHGTLCFAQSRPRAARAVTDKLVSLTTSGAAAT